MPDLDRHPLAARAVAQMHHARRAFGGEDAGARLLHVPHLPIQDARRLLVVEERIAPRCAATPVGLRQLSYADLSLCLGIHVAVDLDPQIGGGVGVLDGDAQNGETGGEGGAGGTPSLVR